MSGNKEGSFTTPVGGEMISFEMKATWKVSMTVRPAGVQNVVVIADWIERRHAELPPHLAKGVMLSKLALHLVGKEELSFLLSGEDYRNVWAAALLLSSFLVGKGCEVNKT